MSTFDGIIREFPDIAVDYFRHRPGRRRPMACFLSHVHSDHLQGLDSLKSPFIYCSPATRELLLRLEKFTHRMNFARGILERRQQTYQHLKSLLKTIPLNTPTEIELRLGYSIRVTLLDANHCAGAVMFLFQDETISVLYTGDIRAEPWWVEALTRNPIMVAFSHHLKTLDNMYLDTTFATKSTPYAHFQTKASGIRQLLEKVQSYPPDTIFHLNAWTFGYEDVWIALAHTFQSQIHVSEYTMGLYQSLSQLKSGTNSSFDGPALCGFPCGNRTQPGCLTSRTDVRLHSCEKCSRCGWLQDARTVSIIPVIRVMDDGSVLPEAGAGNVSSIAQAHELEMGNKQGLTKLLELCKSGITSDKERAIALEAISNALLDESTTLPLGALDTELQKDTLPLAELLPLLARLPSGHADAHSQDKAANAANREYSRTASNDSSRRTNTIYFPYSRHSSYEELCNFVKTFRPRDVYPCVGDDELEAGRLSMKELFGRVCSSETFIWDKEKGDAAHELDYPPSKKQRTFTPQPTPAHPHVKFESTADLSEAIALNESQQSAPAREVWSQDQASTQKSNLPHSFSHESNPSVDQFSTLPDTRAGQIRARLSDLASTNAVGTQDLPPSSSPRPAPDEKHDEIETHSQGSPNEEEQQQESQITLPDSAFESQSSNTSQPPTIYDSTALLQGNSGPKDLRAMRRREAYLRARQTLDMGSGAFRPVASAKGS